MNPDARSRGLRLQRWHATEIVSCACSEPCVPSSGSQSAERSAAGVKPVEHVLDFERLVRDAGSSVDMGLLERQGPINGQSVESALFGFANDLP